MTSEKQPIGILGAMQVEIEAVLEAAEIAAAEEHGSMRFYTGTLSGVPVVVARCSAGKVNSALCAQMMADFYRPRAILNIGVAGGIGKDVHIGDIVIASSCVQYDYDVTAIGQPLGEMNIPPNNREITEIPCDPGLSEKLEKASDGLYGHAHRGVIATGDTFVADPVKGDFLNRQFGALACEMEGGSTAHACLLNGIPCAVLRSISDNANDGAAVDFPTFARESAYKVQKLLAGVVSKL